MFEAIIVHRSLGREDWLLVFCKFLFSWAAQEQAKHSTDFEDKVGEMCLYKCPWIGSSCRLGVSASMLGC